MTGTMNIAGIVDAIISYYKENGRSFPWREDINPYRVFVSEYMLQQTQTDRVVPKHTAFMQKFPDVHALARADRRSVLKQWMGLGYNRRAVSLHEAARIISDTHNGVVPSVKEDLLALPGVGEYTASAVLAFAYDRPVVLVETNIRTVVLHRCIREGTGVSDADVLVVVGEMLRYAQSRGISPRIFYTALMDYGAHLKQNGVTVNARSRHYTKQKPFAGSVRQARGEVLRLLLGKKRGISREEAGNLPERSRKAVEGLVADGIVEERRGRYLLRE